MLSDVLNKLYFQVMAMKACSLFYDYSHAEERANLHLLA